MCIFVKTLKLFIMSENNTVTIPTEEYRRLLNISLRTHSLLSKRREAFWTESTLEKSEADLYSLVDGFVKEVF